MTEYILTLISQTNRNIFLTGKAGTGKTTLLHKIIATTYKNTVVAAPTGIAALNAGGVTIHSLFQLPFASFLPTQSAPPIVNEHLRFENRISLRKHFQMHKNKQQLIRNMELLIVDEVSMLRADVLDAMDYMLQFIRRNHEPFGGVQVLFIGDLMQLPPVVKQEEWEVLKQYYKGMYFFQSEVITKHPLLYVELETIYRQTDKLFVSILNHLRENKLTEEDLQLLQPYVKPAFAKQSKDEYVTLTTHNAKADTMNQHAMQQLRTPAFAYEAEVIGDFPEYLYPTDKVIQLKEGARVMFIKNDPSGEHLFFNGKMGTVLSLTEDSVEVLLDGGQAINVERYVWENLRFRLNETTKDIEEEKLGTFTQYPLRLAWAITIHKSQGLTFEHAIIDASRSFAPGQVYVALSRCKSLEGLVLASPINEDGIINDSRVSDYISRQQQAAEESIERLPDLKEEYYRTQLLDMFNFADIYNAQQMLNRVLLEHFRSYPRMTLFHKLVLQNIKTKVIDVAYKWLTVIRHTSVTDMHSEAFLLRVRRSADYFAAELKAQIPELLEKTKTLQSQNQRTAELLEERYKDLWMAYLQKENLLDLMAEEPFDVHVYMRHKQETMLDAMEKVRPDGGQKKRRRRRVIKAQT